MKYRVEIFMEAKKLKICWGDLTNMVQVKCLFYYLWCSSELAACSSAQALGTGILEGVILRSWNSMILKRNRDQVEITFHNVQVK